MSTATLEKPRINLDDVSVSDKAAASSAHARLNIPLNLQNWKALSDDVQQELAWFHQHALDTGMTLKQCAIALNYDYSVIFRALKGTYEGSYQKVKGAIVSYRKLVQDRGTIQRNEFVENSISHLIFSGLSYALANNSITLIEGESRMGKSVAGRAWRDANNHGRSALVIAPAYGGTKALLRDIAGCIGANKNLNTSQMHESILRGFNKNRILIVDEAHRLLPNDRRANPVNLEVLRDIHDRTGCALALIATSRFGAELRKSEYMFEQLLGRIGMPIRLPRKIKETDIENIVRQYVPRAGVKLMAACLETANAQGRLGILVETLKVASRMAAKEQKSEKPRISDEHVFKAFALRKQMQGELVYAEK
jgi:DNA transposition AAA+ family ATPase